MNRLRRAGFMLVFHAARLLLKVVDSLAPRAYMRVYLTLLRVAGMQLTGVPRYISTGVKFDDFSLISLGDRVVISDRVVLLTHDYSLTTAMISLGERPPTDLAVRRGIAVGNNVFIGMGAMLMPGVTIGDNVIVGAGAVVRGAVPEGSLVIGNPAEVIARVQDVGERWRSRVGSNSVTAD